MKVPYTLAILAFIGAAGLAQGQLFTTAAFYNPDFRATHAEDAVLLTITNTPVTSTLSAGDVSWTHSAGGYAGLQVGVASANLRAFTETTGNTLVFGRQLHTESILGSLDPLLAPVVGASLLSNWSSTAVVSNLDIDAGQLYRVTFNVASGANLPVGLLSSASFGITSPGVTGASNQSASLLSLLGVVSVGSAASTGQYSFDFVSALDRTDLRFQFDAASALSLSLLGNTDGNSNVLTFSNLSVTAIPEPSALALSAVFAGSFLLRRRRVA